jgi:hypothetical protein
VAERTCFSQAPDVFRAAPTQPAAAAALAPEAAAGSDSVDEMEDPLAAAWQTPDIWEVLKQDEGCRNHMLDPEFVRKVCRRARVRVTLSHW